MPQERKKILAPLVKSAVKRSTAAAPQLQAANARPASGMNRDNTRR